MSEAYPIQFQQYMRVPGATWAVMNRETVEWTEIDIARMSTADLPAGTRIARFEFENDPVLNRIITQFDVNADGTLTMISSYVSAVRL